MCVFLFVCFLWLCWCSSPFRRVCGFVQSFQVSFVGFMTGGFRFWCVSRRSVVVCDVVYPLSSGLAEGHGGVYVLLSGLA